MNFILSFENFHKSKFETSKTEKYVWGLRGPHQASKLDNF